MKATLLVLALVAATVALAPPAAAQPCEVPGCQVAGAAVCVVSEGRAILGNPKGAVGVVADCFTAPA